MEALKLRKRGSQRQTHDQSLKLHCYDLFPFFSYYFSCKTETHKDCKCLVTEYSQTMQMNLHSLQFSMNTQRLHLGLLSMDITVE